ncbi:MAG: IS3 family transposase [Desulfobacterales bacterium]|nr:IS3 family transposase [Desulfobacterales bacterium]
MKYKFMQRESQNHCISKMAEVLKISCSGYYSWLKNGPSKRNKDNNQLFIKIMKYEKELNFTYGSKRLTKYIKQVERIPLGHNRVAKVMKENDIKILRSKKWRKPKESKDLKADIPNLLNREFSVEEPNKVWVSDITYVETIYGWNYLCAIMDLHSRKIVGWHFSNTMDVKLVSKAFENALINRKYPKGVMFHSDRGSQYSSNNFKSLLVKNECTQSMSRRGNCWDNACIESFFKSLKYECLHRFKLLRPDEVRMKIFEYIEAFYNRKRLHSTLGYVSPDDYEIKCA